MVAVDYRELTWSDLMPADYQADAIIEKYREQLNQFSDDDPAAMEVYNRMRAEYDNAPANNQLNQTAVKIAGFIAPLEMSKDKITEFLLVPFFGACIHVPPPPLNQIIHVTTDEKNAIPRNQYHYPWWIKGTIAVENRTTDIGDAGYQILAATTERCRTCKY